MRSLSNIRELYDKKQAEFQQLMLDKNLVAERVKSFVTNGASVAYGVWTMFNFTWLMLLTAPFVILPIIVDEKRGGRISFLFLHAWGFGFSALSGVFYKVKGREHLSNSQGYIFAGNHSSFLDSPALVLAIPEQSRALGKKEILSYPVFGFIFRFIGVTVDRSSIRSKAQSMQRIRELISKGIHIMIFPEGTMNTTSQVLTPFRDGAFRLAIETQTPIVPMAIKNSRNLLPRGSWALKPGTITVEFAPPIDTAGMTSADMSKLREKTYQEIRRMLNE